MTDVRACLRAEAARHERVRAKEMYKLEEGEKDFLKELDSPEPLAPHPALLGWDTPLGGECPAPQCDIFVSQRQL